MQADWSILEYKVRYVDVCGCMLNWLLCALACACGGDVSLGPARPGPPCYLLIYFGLVSRDPHSLSRLGEYPKRWMPKEQVLCLLEIAMTFAVPQQHSTHFGWFFYCRTEVRSTLELSLPE